MKHRFTCYHDGSVVVEGLTFNIIENRGYYRAIDVTDPENKKLLKDNFGNIITSRSLTDLIKDIDFYVDEYYNNREWTSFRTVRAIDTFATTSLNEIDEKVTTKK